jgi:dephospho-CoA kinase
LIDKEKKSKKIIGLIGAKQSGKDTFFSFLHPQYMRMAFADNVKKVGEYFGYKEEYKNEKKYRILLQRIGTEIGRFINENIWVEKLLIDIDDHFLNFDTGIIITDMRFENENILINEYCKKNNIQYNTIKILRPSIFKEDSHSSEQYWKEAITDYTIINDGTLEEYHKKIKDLIFEIESKIDNL